MEVDRDVRGQITWRETEVCVVELAASMLMERPRVRAPGHDEEAGAVLSDSSRPPMLHR